jgi:hypothetical protein
MAFSQSVLRAVISPQAITSADANNQGNKADLRGAFGHYGENGGFLREIGSNRGFPR